MSADDDGQVQLHELELEKLSSAKAIAGVAIPAIVLNAAPPVTIAVQTALIGNYAPTAALAAFAAVGTVVGFASRVFNFLVDGVSSKVGRSVGQHAWQELGSHVQLSLSWSAGLGAAAVPLLLLARHPSCTWLLALSEEVQAAAAGYWVLRSAVIPLQLLSMAAAGILQGYGRVRVNATLTSAAAVLEMLGSAAALHLLAKQQAPSSSSDSGGRSLVAVGWVGLACQALLAAASLACIVALPPPEAKGRVNLLRELFGLKGSSGSSSSVEEGARDALQEPLLAGQEAIDGDGLQPPAEGLQPGSQGHAMDPVQQQQQQLDVQPSKAKQQRRWLDEATLVFLRDGLAMFIRTLVLQLTFFMALAAAARLGTTALAAHSIVGQLWVVVSYAVDGFAAAGIVLGSRLYGVARSHPQRQAAAKRHMRRLTDRVLLAGGLSGSAAGLAFYLWRSSMPGLFTADPAVVSALRTGAWGVLALAQPLNGLLFVFDGLMYATQAFLFVRNYMCLGFLLVFCPALAFEYWASPGLPQIWLAKAALNVWRLGGAAYLIYWRFLPRFGAGDTDGRSEGEEGRGGVSASAEPAAV